MSNLIPFCFDQHSVRVIEQDGQPWFVASDVAAALDYAEAKDLTRNLDMDEKGRQIVPTRSASGVLQDREVLVINESGLYSAILKSRKPAAKRFKKWVTAEVLPAIRKHGRYESAQPAPALLDPSSMLRALLSGERMLCGLDDMGRISLREIPSTNVLLNPANLPEWIADCGALKPALLGEIACAALRRLRGHGGNHAVRGVLHTLDPDYLLVLESELVLSLYGSRAIYDGVKHD